MIKSRNWMSFVISTMITARDMVSLVTPPKKDTPPRSAKAPGSIHCQYVPSCNPNVSTVALPRIRPYKPPTSSCADLRFFFFYTNCKQFTEL